MPSPPQRPRPFAQPLAMALVLAAAALFAYQVGHRLLREPTRWDDAYMAIRYADHLLAGQGVAWNPDGAQTYGMTSLLHLALVTLLRALLPTLRFARGMSGELCLVSSVAALVGLAILAAAPHQLARSDWLRRHGRACGAALAVVLLSSPLFVTHALSGMDTAVAFAANAWLAVRAARWSASGKGLPLLVAAAWLACAARPDNLLYALAVPPLLMLASAWPARRRLALHYSLASAAVLALDAGLKALWFGSPVPLGVLAKRWGFLTDYAGEGLWNPWRFLGQFLLAALPALGLIAWFGGPRRGRLLAALLLPVAATCASLFGFVHIMGTSARYFWPSLPYVVLCAVLVCDDACLAAQAGAPRHPPSGIGLLRLAAGFSVAVAAIGLADDAFARRHARPPSLPLAACFAPRPSAAPPIDSGPGVFEMATLARQLPVGTSIALSEHGIVGALAPDLTLIDMVGLHDPQFARHGPSSARVLDRRPDLIWGPHRHYQGLQRSLLSDPRFARDYEYFADIYRDGIALRRDSPRYLALRTRLAAALRVDSAGAELDAFAASGFRADRAGCPLR